MNVGVSPKFEQQILKNLCADLREALRAPTDHSYPSSPTGQGKSYRIDLG